jgi:hypothetical protein
MLPTYRICHLMATTSVVSMKKVLVRVDADGNSICCGQEVVRCQFVCSTTADYATLRYVFLIENRTASRDLCILTLRERDFSQTINRFHFGINGEQEMRAPYWPEAAEMAPIPLVQLAPFREREQLWIVGDEYPTDQQSMDTRSLCHRLVQDDECRQTEGAVS